MPLNFVPPTKPEKKEKSSNEFFYLDDLKLLSGEFIVEPKYDGVRLQLHKKEEKFEIFTDDGKSIKDKFPDLSKHFLKSPHTSFILDGEMVKYRGKTRLSYKDVSESILNKDFLFDTHFKYKVFDILYLNGKDLTSNPLNKRKEILQKSFEESQFLNIVKFEKVSDDKIKDVIERLSTSEGAMIKSSTSEYFDSKDWFKWKKNFQLDCLVTKVIENKGGTFNYLCALGPREVPFLLGTTYSTNIRADAGEILRVQIDYLTKTKDGFTWHAPKVLDKRMDKKEPDFVLVLERMIKKEDRDLRFEKEREKRFVLQEHFWGESRHHDLRFEKVNRLIGLTLFRLNLADLKKGRRFLCEWKDEHSLKWLDFEGEIPPGEDSEGNPSKNKVSYMKILDKGEYEILEEEKNFFSFKISGKILNGVYLVRKVKLNEIDRWLFWKKKEEVKN